MGPSVPSSPIPWPTWAPRVPLTRLPSNSRAPGGPHEQVTTRALAAGLAIATVFSAAGAVAAAKITSNDIKNDTIRSQDIKNETIRSKDIRNRTVQGVDLDERAIQFRNLNQPLQNFILDILNGDFGSEDGARGPAGPAGADGENGARGPAGVNGDDGMDGLLDLYTAKPGNATVSNVAPGAIGSTLVPCIEGYTAISGGYDLTARRNVTTTTLKNGQGGDFDDVNSRFDAWEVKIKNTSDPDAGNNTFSIEPYVTCAKLDDRPGV